MHVCMHVYISVHVYIYDIPWNTGSAGTLYTLIAPPPLVPQGLSKM